MKDIQRYRIATIMYWIGLILLVLSLFLTPVDRVYDTFESGDSGIMLLLSILGLLTGGTTVSQLYAIATILTFLSIYHCRGGGYLGQKRIPILPTAAILISICFAWLVPSMPLQAINVVSIQVGWTGYAVWMLSLICVLTSSLLQRSIDYSEEQENATAEITEELTSAIHKDKRSFVERVFGGEPSGSQRVYFVAFLLTLLLWPMIAFVSIFIFDAPIHNLYDEIVRYGIVLTIWTYPILLFVLFRLGYKLSERSNSPVWFYAMPWTPFILVVAFSILASSEVSQYKPDDYDSKTFVRIDKTYSKDKNHAYLNNEVIEGALPDSFEVLAERYSKDALHVFYEHELVPGADPSTFVVTESPTEDFFVIILAHDNKDYYHRSTPLHVADYDSFKPVEDGWFIDRKLVYYEGYLAREKNSVRMPISDYDSFRVLNERYACDDRCVYYTDTIVEGADPATIRVIKGQLAMAQDRYCVYYEGKATEVKDFAKLVSHPLKASRGIFYTEGSNIYTSDLKRMPEGTDMSSLRRVNDYRDWYVDKNRVYYENKVIPGVSPSKIEIFPVHYLSENYASNNNKNSYYSHDGTHVYYRDSLMNGVDIATFKCGYDYEDSISFAFDKNKYYKGHSTPLTEKLKAGNIRVDSY